MLNIGLERFAWERPRGRKKGFVWEGEGNEARLVRIPGVAFENYYPHSGLYRDFADLAETKEATLQFANKYGSLEVVEPPPVNQVMYGRWWGDWLLTIQWMKKMVALADAVQAGDLAAIRDALGPLKADFDSGHLLALGEIPEAIRDPYRLAPDDVAKVASTVIYQPAVFSLNWVPEATWNPRTKSVDARLKFHSIRGFMYVQLCISMIQRRQFQQCKVCGKWFQLAPGVGRADKTTCSPSCRFISYRRRKQQAVELYAKGKSIKEIAKKLGSEVNKVKQWVSKAKE
jgi:hypothetical protein